MLKRNDVEVTAYHEAGHAVMAMAVGLPVTHISIEPNDSSKGSVGWQQTTEFDDKYYRQRAVLVLMSGMTADYIHWENWGHGSDDDAPHGCKNDHINANKHLSALNENGLLEAYIVSSKRFLARADVWQFVDGIAKMLICFRKIDGESCLSDLTNRCPKFDEKDWDCLNRIKHLVSKSIGI